MMSAGKTPALHMVFTLALLLGGPSAQAQLGTLSTKPSCPPSFVFDGEATQAGDGTLKLTVKWKDQAGAPKSETVDVTVPNGASDEDVAKAAVAALNANATIAADWKFTRKSSFGYQIAKGEPAAGRTPKGTGAGVDNDGGATTPVTGISAAGAIDPPIPGTALFDVFGTASAAERGEITLGLEAQFVTTLTYLSTPAGPVDKTPLMIKLDLLDELHGAGYFQAFLDGGTGFITVPGVSTGKDPDTFTGNPDDIGAMFLTTDGDLGGMAMCLNCAASVVPEPAAGLLIAPGALGVLLWSARRRRERQPPAGRAERSAPHR